MMSFSSQRKIRHMLTAVTVAVSSAVVVAVANPPDSFAAPGLNAAEPKPRPAHTTAMPLPRDLLIDALEKLGRSSYEDSYGGISFEDDETVIHIYLTSTDNLTRNAFETLAKGFPVRFSEVPNSSIAVQRVHAEVTKSLGDLRSEGFKIDEYGPSPTRGVEDIGLLRVRDSDQEALTKRFGAGLIRVYQVAPENVGGKDSLQASRGVDRSPWNAGDVIFGNSYDGISFCTTGFGVKIRSSGNWRILTAGHCIIPGEDAYNANRGDYNNNSNKVGRVTSTNLDDAVPMDTELIGAMPFPIMWAGPIGNGAIATVDGALSNHVGTHVCASGSYGGDVCDSHLTVTRTGFCKALDSTNSCNLMEATNTDGAPLTKAGDSGGPWYRDGGADHGVYAVGIHRGLVGNRMYYTGMGSILDVLNADLCTNSSC